MAVSWDDLPDARGALARLDEYSHAADRRVLRDCDRRGQPVADVLQMQNGLAESDWSGNSSRGGIYVRLHSKFMVRAGNMGLHGEIRQYIRADMRTVRDFMVFSHAVRDMGRRLSAVGILAGRQQIQSFKHI